MLFCWCTGLAPGSDRLAPKAQLGARAGLRLRARRARAAKGARRGAGHKPGRIEKVCYYPNLIKLFEDTFTQKICFFSK